MCEASGVGVILDAEKIPAEAEVKQAADVAGIPPWKFAFASGGDFQFIVTTPAVARSRMEGFGLIEIGRITRGRDLLLRSSDGRLLQLPIKGHRDRRNLRFAEEIDVLIHGRIRRKVPSA
jgi:thiamine monophosphate kinase